ncbi:uncharacterized protein LOC101852302 [Aplysia californica]|uniref:Uncharacterized protein LOC101852302 n=1 Tax=Aplysia californica TaxID=6500 RepID=A0ABM0JD71_APLCA|nr:uncharacterized protein LOC101852302 [Aplysia californica]
MTKCMQWTILGQMIGALDFKKILDMQCADKNIKYNCLGQIQVPANRAVVHGCVKNTVEAFKNESFHRRVCEINKNICICQDDFVRTCDAYTAWVYKQFTDPLLRKTCGSSVIIG